MSSPLVSIVLPTFNRAAMLPTAIASCLNQTFEDLEVIVVDDGSTDATGEVLSRLGEGNPRLHCISQANTGLPGALNRGFAMARGKFWTWTSDDNRYHPKAIEEMKADLDRNPQCGMVYTDFQIVDKSGGVRSRVQDRRPEDLPSSNVVGPCFLYRREVAEKAGIYNPELKLAEDWDYWLRLAQITSIRHMPGILYDFQDHTSSLTQQRELQIQEAVLKMRKLTRHPEARKHLYRKSIARRLATLHWARGNWLKGTYFRMQAWGY